MKALSFCAHVWRIILVIAAIAFWFRLILGLLALAGTVLAKIATILHRNDNHER